MERKAIAFLEKASLIRQGVRRNEALHRNARPSNGLQRTYLTEVEKGDWTSRWS
jgi:hypothetical protein